MYVQLSCDVQVIAGKEYLSEGQYYQRVSDCIKLKPIREFRWFHTCMQLVTLPKARAIVPNAVIIEEPEVAKKAHLGFTADAPRPIEGQAAEHDVVSSTLETQELMSHI